MSDPFVILIGDKFTRWTVVSGPTKRPANSNFTAWFCRCECGSEKWVSALCLISEASKGCTKCRNWKKRDDDAFPGKTVAGWTVLEYFGQDKQRCYLYKCVCDCGEVALQTASALRNKRPKLCENCLSKSRIEFTWNQIYRTIKSGAAARNLSVEVTKDFCRSLLLSQKFECALSGIQLVVAKTAREHEHGKTTASLDRIDSSKGYLPENVQWVHKDINRMKMDLSQERFIQLCDMVSKNCQDSFGGHIDSMDENAA